MGTNVAVRVTSAVAVNEQVPVPEQPPPLHPVKVDPRAAVALRWSWWPVSTPALQSAWVWISQGTIWSIVPKPLAGAMHREREHLDERGGDRSRLVHRHRAGERGSGTAVARPPGEHGVGGRGHEQQELGAIGVVGRAIRRARVQVARQGVAHRPGARTGGAELQGVDRGNERRGEGDVCRGGERAGPGA